MVAKDLKKFTSPVFPFTAIVGQEEMKLALQLNVIDPKIGGVMIMGDRGTGKSTTIRAIADLLPKIEVVKGDPFNSHKSDLDLMGNEVKQAIENNETLETEQIKIPMIDLPLGATEDRVEILRDFSPLIEQVSVDEAYLELQPEQQASEVAREIRERVRNELGITVSVGGAPNKFLAKVASDWNKPDGQKMIPPERVDEFVRVLPVGKISGVGPAFQGRLKAVGIETCGDARDWDLKELVRRFGRSGVLIYQRCRGQDNRVLSMERIRKSVSVERTYAKDLQRQDECLAEIPALYERWQERIARTPWQAEALAPFVKVKFDDFTQTTLADVTELATPEGFGRLLMQALQREDKPVRLLGIGGRFPQVSEQQLSLF